MALVVKNLPACLAGSIRDMSSTPRSGKSPRVGNDSLLQYSSLENSTGRGAWWAIDRGAAESDTTEQLNAPFLITSYPDSASKDPRT